MLRLRTPWRLFHHWDGEPGFHMALDEALLLSQGAPPTLRFYTWKPDALSLGYFQRYEEVAPAARGLSMVRRLTGGGAIHHVHELTFSIACDQDHPLYRGEVRASYERVHGLLADVLAELGVEPHLRGDGKVHSDSPGSVMCFHESTDLDLCWNGAKGVGSAQRRTQGRVLHHGSIKLAGSDWETGVAELLPTAPGLTPQDLAQRIERRFESLGFALEDGELSTEEERRSRGRASFFGSQEFLGRR